MSSRLCTFSIRNTMSSSQITQCSKTILFCSKTISLWFWLCWFLIVFFDWKQMQIGHAEKVTVVSDNQPQWSGIWLVVPVRIYVYFDINSYLSILLKKFLERFRTIYPNWNGQGTVPGMHENTYLFCNHLRYIILIVHLWTFDQHALMVTVRPVHGNASVVMC